MHEATARLLELGLSDKEAGVYLAMLELGPASVQDIAKKSGVNRSTTYLTLEDLKQRGLASGSIKGKKALFTAESPSRLTSVLNREKQELEEKKKKLEDSIPYFMALYNAVEDKPQVRFFEGDEGIMAVREILQQSRGEFLTFTALDEGTYRISKIDEKERLKMTKRMHGRCIMTFKPGVPMLKADTTNWEIREIPYESSPFTGEINIIDNKVAALVAKTRPIAFLVENKEMAELFRSLFNVAWSTAKKVDKKKFLS